MCGIAGIFDPTFSRISKDRISNLVEGMVDIIRHRGPDDKGLYCENGLGLGCARLSILDLSVQGHMPMIDGESGNCIVHNGEVYNYRELKDELGLSGFKSNTDTEVVLKAYSKHGIDCIKKFNGMYAFSIWDKKKRRLFCVRDRIGIKPFFYAFHKDVFYFASEIKSLLKCGIPRKPNMKVIYDYLVYGVYDHSEETFFDGIKQLLPGHLLVMEPGCFSIKRYWDIDPGLESSDNSLLTDFKKQEEAKEKFMVLFEDSVRLRLRSDVPIAVHISGGLDSTMMMGTIDKLKGGQGDLKAFSYYFGDKRYDEKPYVEELVKKSAWDVEYYKLTPTEIPSLAEEAMWHHEQPFPGIITLAKHQLIKQSHGFGAKVILEGQGGDEIGAGYQYVFGPHLLDLLQRGSLRALPREIRAFGEQNGLSTKESLTKVMNGILAYYRVGRSADGTLFIKPHCLNPDFLKRNKHKIGFPKYFKSNLLNMQYRDIFHTKLQRILRACDRASMAHSRELRVPILDHRLVEFSFSLPGNFKIRNGIQRNFLREALKTNFPSRLINVPKRAVVDPQREWLKESLSDWVWDIFHSDSFKNREIFNHIQIQNEYKRYKEQRTNLNSFHLWQWLSMELWYRTFMDGELREAA